MGEGHPPIKKPGLQETSKRGLGTEKGTQDPPTVPSPNPSTMYCLRGHRESLPLGRTTWDKPVGGSQPAHTLEPSFLRGLRRLWRTRIPGGEGAPSAVSARPTPDVWGWQWGDRPDASQPLCSPPEKPAPPLPRPPPRPSSATLGGKRGWRTLAQMLNSCKLLAGGSPAGAADKPYPGLRSGPGGPKEAPCRPASWWLRVPTSQAPANLAPDTRTLAHPNPLPRCHLNDIPPSLPRFPNSCGSPRPHPPPPSQAPFCTISGQGGGNRRRKEGEGGRAGC